VLFVIRNCDICEIFKKIVVDTFDRAEKHE